MSSSFIFYSTFCFVLFIVVCDSFTASRLVKPLASNPSFALGTAIYYQSESPSAETTTIAQPIFERKIPKPSKVTEIMVEEITSLNELKWFLEEDERPVIIKFYAKWCKKCQRLGLKVNRLAMHLGDRIVDKQFVDGDVRFAAVEYNQDTHEFITEDLQIRGFPTLQMYVGTHKLLEAGSSVPNIRKELALIGDIGHEELLLRAEEADDGVLTGLIEESFFDSPDFLNEEW